MKAVLVSLGSLFSLGLISLQNIPIVINIVVETIIGILTIIYLIRKLKKQNNE